MQQVRPAERLAPERAAHPVPVRTAGRRPARVAGRARPGRRVPGGGHHPRRRAPASCFLRAALRDAGDVKRVQGGELELFRTDYRGAYTGAFDAYVPDRGVPKVYPAPPARSPPCRLFEIPADDFGARWEWFPMAAHLLEGARSRARPPATSSSARAAGGARLGDGRPHPRAEQPGGGGDAGRRQAARDVTEMRDKVGVMVASHLPPTSSKRSRHWPRRSSAAGRPRTCRRWRRPIARTSWPTGWRTTASAAREVAPTLVAAGVDLTWLEGWRRCCRRRTWRSASPTAVRPWSPTACSTRSPTPPSASRLLASAKQYTQMDRAPLQTFDVHEGLDATLTMLGHKLGEDIEIVRDYDRRSRTIAAFPGELNQVWTNLIDNAVDAMDGHGAHGATRPVDDDRLMVEIGDTGPGVPDEVRAQVSSRFTAKEVGKGTGLGLDIAWRIVVGRHRGDPSGSRGPGGHSFRSVLPRSPRGLSRQAPATGGKRWRSARTMTDAQFVVSAPRPRRPAPFIVELGDAARRARALRGQGCGAGLGAEPDRRPWRGAHHGVLRRGRRWGGRCARRRCKSRSSGPMVTDRRSWPAAPRSSKTRRRRRWPGSSSRSSGSRLRRVRRRGLGRARFPGARRRRRPADRGARPAPDRSGVRRRHVRRRSGVRSQRPRVVSAVRGGPEPLVSGEVDGSQYVLSRHGRGARVRRQRRPQLDRAATSSGSSASRTSWRAGLRRSRRTSSGPSPRTSTCGCCSPARSRPRSGCAPGPSTARARSRRRSRRRSPSSRRISGSRSAGCREAVLAGARPQADVDASDVVVCVDGTSPST